MDCHLMVGDKVVCISDAGWSDEIKAYWTCPKVGEIYTIRDVGLDYWGSGSIAIRLVEITNRLTSGVKSSGVEPNFWVGRFRRVIDTTETVAEMAAIVRREFKPTPSKKEAVK